MNSTMASEGASTEAIFDTFCSMVVEEYLVRKNLTATLDTMRAEWQRPPEVQCSLLCILGYVFLTVPFANCFTQEQVTVSWFEVALKLRLPELITQNSKDKSVLENVVQALVRESSIRSRQTPEVILTGLAAMPKTTSLPQIVDHHHEAHHIPLPRSPAGHSSSHAHKTDKAKSTAKTHQSTQQHLIKRQLDMSEKQFGATRQANKPVFSNEAWIPNDIRMRTLGRDISVATETLEVIKKREVSLAREMRRLMVSDLQRAKTEESLDAAHMIPCECCLQLFLYVNLPLKVSRKAIVDIRTKWSGKLSSATVFGGPDPNNPDGEDGEGSPAKSKQQRALDRKNQLLSSVPACYDQVGVCVFCAQFFQVQEEYRPSYLAITQSERKAAAMEARRREREYWDPLKMVQKDRAMQEQREHEMQLLAMQQQEQGLDGGGGDGTGDDGRLSK